MKLIAINRKAGEPIKSIHSIELYPDSAPVQSGKPVFLPDWGGNVGFKAVLCPAYRIGRLGKSIGERFAPRYRDAVTLAARLYPSNSPITPEIARPDIVKAWEGSVIFGKWQPIGDDGRFILAPQADPSLRLGVTPEGIDIDGMIAAVSAVMTLKMGDIIIPCYLDTPMSLAIDDVIRYRLNDVDDTLIMKIK